MSQECQIHDYNMPDGRCTCLIQKNRRKAPSPHSSVSLLPREVEIICQHYKQHSRKLRPMIKERPDMAEAFEKIIRMDLKRMREIRRQANHGQA